MDIPFLKPPFGIEEKNAVMEVMSTGNLTVGPQVPEFEESFAKYIGVKHAIAVNSGSSALEISLKSLILTCKLAKSDKIIVPSYTYVAVANAVRNVGLVPVFAEMIPDKLTIDPSSIYKLANRHNAKGVIIVHTAGLPCEMSLIMDIIDEFNLVLIEDCAEATGAEFNGRKVGSYGICSMFSFTPTKPMTTCEGGMIVTDDNELADCQSKMRNQGIVMQSKYVKDVIINSSRMSNIAAAIGIQQLKKLDNMIARRIENSQLLTFELGTILPYVKTNYIVSEIYKHVYQLFLIRFTPHASINREYVLDVLAENGIECRVFFDRPIHTMSNYKKAVIGDHLQYTEYIAQNTFALPMYPTLTNEEIKHIADTLKLMVAINCR
jgi:perosamine synthetase